MAPEFREVLAQPWPDGKRVMVSFLWEGEGPVDIEIVLRSTAGDVWARMIVVEVHEPRMDMTLHLRGEFAPGAQGIAELQLLQDGAKSDRRTVEFTLPSE